jgi:hypothetical protein
LKVVPYVTAIIEEVKNTQSKSYILIWSGVLEEYINVESLQIRHQQRLHDNRYKMLLTGDVGSFVKVVDF